MSHHVSNTTWEAHHRLVVQLALVLAISLRTSLVVAKEVHAKWLNEVRMLY